LTFFWFRLLVWASGFALEMNDGMRWKMGW
jgi:hypothetical protein